ncbi:hypothetical protein EVAR_52915_1 [Eumeta japonica]|uniref:Uncharacterized protein n=1 Tax=Eumeta variegata TaxID=151549 RepID=A0A4C1Y8A7_EUMVA|nr:hypothetical protein EVAR_52915_1 [Eumeta japonica]
MNLNNHADSPSRNVRHKIVEISETKRRNSLDAGVGEVCRLVIAAGSFGGGPGPSVMTPPGQHQIPLDFDLELQESEKKILDLPKAKCNFRKGYKINDFQMPKYNFTINDLPSATERRPRHTEPGLRRESGPLTAKAYLLYVMRQAACTASEQIPPKGILINERLVPATRIQIGCWGIFHLSRLPLVWRVTYGRGLTPSMRTHEGMPRSMCPITYRA